MKSIRKSWLGLYGIAGAAATIGLVWLFLYVADEIPERGTLVRIDTLVARWLETHGTEGGEAFFHGVSYLGAPVLIASVVAALLWFAWRRAWRDAAALAITATGGVALSTALKLIFQRGRPETATEFITHHSWSFPSGHAMNSMVSYGFLAVLLLHHVADSPKRATILIVAALLIGVIGFSRLYLGVHYLSDVVGGWMAGAAWLIVCTWGYQHATDRASQR